MSLWTHPDFRDDHPRREPERPTSGTRPLILAFAAVLAIFAVFIGVRPFSAEGPVRTQHEAAASAVKSTASAPSVR